jgi:hypothetical protein
MLVRQYLGSIPGWSLLLPAGWGMPFWQALAYQGKASRRAEDVPALPAVHSLSHYRKIRPQPKSGACCCLVPHMLGFGCHADR